MKVLVSLLIICVSVYCSSFHAFGQSVPSDTYQINVQLISPEENSTTVAKKPVIQCRIEESFSPENILVLFDGTDITGVLDFTSEGFTYKPIQVIPAGLHSLTVMITRQDGQELSREIIFSTRHHEKFEEASSKNEVSAVYEGVLDKPKDVNYIPHSRVEANLNSVNIIKEKKWEISFNTNVRFLDRNLPVFKPERKGFTLVDALLQAKYSSPEFLFSAEIGDVYINETPGSVYGLARKGGKFSIGYKDVSLNAFVVDSEQIYGYRDFSEDIGIEGTTDDHIMGVSGEVKLFSDRAQFKTVYVKGGEPGSSFGYSTTGGNREGEVVGFALKTDIIQQKLSLDAEVDFSRYDADTSDEFSSDSDKTYRIRASGYAGKYNYSAAYEYVGPDYEVIGNQGFQKDREGFLLTAGANYSFQSFNLSFSRYNNNVDNDDLYPRSTIYQGTIDYTFNKFPQLPIGINYSKSITDSSDEPEFYDPVRLDIDSLSVRLNYIKRPFDFGFSANYSIQNDRTSSANDTSTLTFRFAPVYSEAHFFISPGFSFNQSKYDLSDLRIDTYTANLDIRGDFLNTKLTYEFAGTYNLTESNDDTTDVDTYNMNLRIGYCFAKDLWGFLNPTVGLRGQYNKTNDRVYSRENEELIILAVLSLSMPFSF